MLHNRIENMCEVIGSCGCSYSCRSYSFFLISYVVPPIIFKVVVVFSNLISISRLSIYLSIYRLIDRAIVPKHAPNKQQLSLVFNQPS